MKMWRWNIASRRMNVLWKNVSPMLPREGIVDLYATMNERFSVPSFRDIKNAHDSLISSYVLALNYISLLPAFISSASDYPKPSNLYRKLVSFLRGESTFSFLISFFVQSHIRTKLKELEIGYLFLSQSMPEKQYAFEEYQVWLKNAQESCSKIANTLVSRYSIQAIAGSTVTIASTLGVLALASNLYDLIVAQISAFNLSSVIALFPFLLIFSPLFWLYSAIAEAFWLKGEILLGKFAFVRQSDMPSIGGTSARIPEKENSYRLEDDLFRLIQRGKVRELPLYWIMKSFYAFLAGGILIVFALDPNKVDYVMLITGALVLLFGLYMLKTAWQVGRR